MAPTFEPWTEILNFSLSASTLDPTTLQTEISSASEPTSENFTHLESTFTSGTMENNDTTASSTSEPYLLAHSELIFASVILIIILIAGIIGNSMIIWSVILSRKLRTSTNAFVVSLAVADLLTSLFLPWYVTAFLGKDGWPLPKAEWLCGATGFMVFTCTGASLYNLAGIAINRLVYIRYPLKYKRIFRPCTVVVMVTLTWLLPGGVIVVCLLAGIGGFGYETVDYPSCSDLDDVTGAGIFNLVQVIIGFPIPLVAILICYAWIYIHIHHHFKNKMARQISLMEHAKAANNDSQHTNRQEEELAESARQELEITKNLFLVVCAFFVCFMPFFVANAIPNAGHFVFYASLLTFANSAINFAIYASRHPQFKVVLGCMIKCKYADIPKPSDVLKAILARKY